MQRSQTDQTRQRWIRQVRLALLCVLLCGSQLAALAGFLTYIGRAEAINDTKQTVSDKGRGDAQPNQVLPDPYVNMVANATTYTVGDVITYTITAGNSSLAVPLLTGPVAITSILPIGLSQLQVVSSVPAAWSISIPSTTSPATIIANYVGAFPIAPNTQLPTLTVTGVLTASAIGTLVHSVSLSALGDIDVTNNTVNLAVNVLAAVVPTTTVGVPTVTASVPTPTPTLAVSPTVSAPTPTVAVSPTVSVPTPTVAVSPTVALPSPTIALSPTVAVPSVTVEVPTATIAVPTPTVAVPSPTLAPLGTDLTILATVQGGISFKVGDPVIYSFLVSNVSSNSVVIQPNTVVVRNVIPLGFSSVGAAGNNWNIASTSATSPSSITATFTGRVTLAPGQFLPVLRVSGILTDEVFPVFTTTATLSALTDFNLTNNVAVTSVYVATSQFPTQFVPSPTVIPTTYTPVAEYDLAVSQDIANGSSFIVGQGIIFDTYVSNASNTQVIIQPNTVSISVVIPSGLASIAGTGNGWSYATTSTTSPATITATFNQPYILSPGGILPVFSFAGLLTETAVPQLVLSTTVNVTGDSYLPNNSTVTVVPVSPGEPSVPTPTVEATSTVAVPSVTVEPTSTVAVPSVTVEPTSTVAVPSVTVEPTLTIAVPSVTVEPTLPALQVSDLSLATVMLSGSLRYVSGEAVTMSILTSNALYAGPVIEEGSVVIRGIVPLGLDQIAVTGADWDIDLTATSGPALLTATYTGTYPILPGALLPALTLTGNLTDEAVPTLTFSPVLDIVSDLNLTNNLSILNLLVSRVPVATPTPIPSTTPPPDVRLTKYLLDDATAIVGDTVNYTLVVSNALNVGPVSVTNSIVVTDVIPLGLRGLVARGEGWNISISNSISPTVITAVYQGAYPIAPGGVLPPITITGVLTPYAIPALSTTSTVSALGDTVLTNNMVTTTLFALLSSLPLPSTNAVVREE